MSVLKWREGVTLYIPGACYDGYTIYSPVESPYVYMIDMNGEVVHVWAVNIQRDDEKEGVTIGTTYCYKYLKNRNLLVLVDGFGLKEIDWDSCVVWQYRIKGVHHDFVRLGNGNTLILYRELKKSPPIFEKPVYNDSLREVTPSGETVWEWHSVDHFEDFGFSKEAQSLILKEGEDWLHTNTVDVLPDGNIMTCFRHLGMIAIVDKATGKFIWKYDNLIGPHHPNMIENGNIIVYDNGGWSGYPVKFRDYTRLVEINPKTNKIVWEYSYLPPNWVRTHRSHHLQARHRSQFYSRAWGSIQRLPNGNTLTLDATGGRLFEITSEGEIVWEFVNPYLGLNLTHWDHDGALVMNRGVYRCYRIAYEDAPEAFVHIKPVRWSSPFGPERFRKEEK